MDFLESDFAQVEHINQVLANNLSHESWACFSTVDLLRQYPQLGSYNTSNPDRSYVTFPKTVKNLRGKVVRGHKYIRYDSFIVSIARVQEEMIDDTVVDYYEYTFEVRNSLWDGSYRISKTLKNSNGEYEQFNEDDFEVKKGDDGTSTKSGNTVIFRFKGTDKGRVRICFHMTMSGSTRNILETTTQLMLETEKEFEHQFNTTNNEKAMVYYANGNKAKNVTVTLIPSDEAGRAIQYSDAIGSWIPAQELHGVTGSFEMPYGPTDKPGVYYCLMEASVGESSTSQIVKVNKVQQEQAVLDWGDEENYKNIWKGCKHKYHLVFRVLNKFGVESDNGDRLIGNPVNITFIHMGRKRETYTSVIQKDEENDEYFVEIVISYRGYYDDFSYLEVELSSDYYFGRVMEQKLIKHPWYIANSYTDIISQLYLVNSNGKYVDESGSMVGNGLTVSSAVANDMGTDWIFVENGSYQVDRTLFINRDVTIASIKGNGRCVFEGNSRNIIQTVAPSELIGFMKVNLIGLTFQNAECAVYSNGGTRLLVDRCYFTNNSYESMHHKGCSIYIPDTDYSRKNKQLWKTEIRNSYFYNNRGNEIQSIGTTRIVGNLFVTDNASYLQQPEVKVVSVRAGSVSYTDNTSYINTGKKPMKSNHSFAKALTFVEKGATFNGVGPSQLGGDRKLPVFGKFNNKAYTYAIYYYPYDNVKTEIVCSPRKGFERQATGHGSSYKRWIYYDGYYFVRWENGRNVGNTYNPWTDEELAVPENLGIFDVVSEKFIEDYDPRISHAKSNVSFYD